MNLWCSLGMWMLALACVWKSTRIILLALSTSACLPVMRKVRLRSLELLISILQPLLDSMPVSFLLASPTPNPSMFIAFLITGKQADVLKAKRMILVDFQTQADASIHIPKEHHRFLLGKGGSKLQELERQT